MAYNTSKGKRDLGDIEYEGDPDTQIDFENNTIRLRTNDKIRFSVVGAEIKTEHALSCSVGFALLDKADNYARVLAIDSTGLISASSDLTASAIRGVARRVTFPIKTVTTTYTASVKDYTILANTETRNITVLLPTAAVASQKIYNIKKLSSLNTLTLTSSSGRIDGNATQTVTNIYESYTLHSDGTVWHII